MVLIDPRTKAVVGQITVPGWPHEAAFSEDGKTAYLPSYSDAIVGKPGLDGQTIDAVDMPTRTVVQTGPREAAPSIHAHVWGKRARRWFRPN